MTDKLREWVSAQFPSPQSESPIEQLLYSSMLIMWDHLNIPRGTVVLSQQSKVGKYRADFLFVIKPEGGDPERLVVEVDGHDFHERTKEQAAKDKARDRWMTGNGFQVIRFTGSEIWANPFAVATECAERIHKITHGKTTKQARLQAGMDALRRLVASEG